MTLLILVCTSYYFSTHLVVRFITKWDAWLWRYAHFLLPWHHLFYVWVHLRFRLKVSHFLKSYHGYRTRAIITHSLYIFYPLFEGQKHLFKDFFLKNMPLCMVSHRGLNFRSLWVSIQEWSLIKNSLWWLAYGSKGFCS